MPSARSFTFSTIYLEADQQRITFEYLVHLSDDTPLKYADVLEFPDTEIESWDRIPRPLLTTLLETLSLIVGINYWKIHCAPRIEIEGFALTRKQAGFWDTVYTKGLGEFFYRSHTDFRGLVSFPYDDATLTSPAPLSVANTALVLNGGGKDSVLSAEMLKGQSIPFELCVVSERRVHRAVANVIGKPLVRVRRHSDPALIKLRRDKKIAPGYPSIVSITLMAVLAAALRGHRYVVSSNESSSESGNLHYLGLEVNHQWSKSLEAERLMRTYISDFITPDIIPFSLLRAFTELETARRFSAYPQYFKVFSSCNNNFSVPETVIASPTSGGVYWCNKCPKCVFIFASLSAFLPKATVLEIFGANLYDDPMLLPMFLKLLGLEGFKPFECVGTSEEMKVAVWTAMESGSYDADAIIALLYRALPLNPSMLRKLRERVLAPGSSQEIPREFSGLANR